MTGSRTGTHARTLALAPAPQPPTARLRGPVCVCARARVRTCVRASVRAHRSRVAPPAQRRTHAVLIAPYCALLCLAGTALHARHAYCALLRLIVSSRHSNARRPCSAQTRSRQVRSNPPPLQDQPQMPLQVSARPAPTWPPSVSPHPHPHPTRSNPSPLQDQPQMPLQVSARPAPTWPPSVSPHPHPTQTKLGCGW